MLLFVEVKVMNPAVVQSTAALVSTVMPLVVPPPAIPVIWIPPVTVLTVVEAPVIKIPSFEEEPVEDPVPFRVIGAMPELVILPELET